MNVARDSALAVDQTPIVQMIPRQTQALLDTLLGGFLEIDLQFKLVLDAFTGGQVVTHLSREADRMADAVFAATGGIVPPVDVDRQWDVGTGGFRPAAVLIEDFIESSARLQEAMTGMRDWSSHDDDICGIPATRVVQLAVHHADLTGSFSSVSEEAAAIAVSALSRATAPEVGGARLVIVQDQPRICGGWSDGGMVAAGNALALLAWASGRAGSDNSRLGDLPAPPRRTWF